MARRTHQRWRRIGVESRGARPASLRRSPEAKYRSDVAPASDQVLEHAPEPVEREHVQAEVDRPVVQERGRDELPPAAVGHARRVPGTCGARRGSRRLSTQPCGEQERALLVDRSSRAPSIVPPIASSIRKTPTLSAMSPIVIGQPRARRPARSRPGSPPRVTFLDALRLPRVLRTAQGRPVPAVGTRSRWGAARIPSTRARSRDRGAGSSTAARPLPPPI